MDLKVKLRPVTLCEVFILFFLIHESMNLERTLTAGEVFILCPHCWLLVSHPDMCVVDHIAPRYDCPYNLLWNCPFLKVLSLRTVNVFPEENSRTFKKKDTKGADETSVNYLPSWNTIRSVRLLMGKECCFSHTQGLLYKTKQEESSTYECISTHFKISCVRVFLLSACDIEEKHGILWCGMPHSDFPYSKPAKLRYASGCTAPKFISA